MTILNGLLIYSIHKKSKEVLFLTDKIESVDYRILNDSILTNVNLWIGSQKLPINVDTILFPYQYRLVYRYSSKMCQACIQTGVDVFNDTFNNDFEDVLIVVSGKENFIKLPYKSVEFDEEFLSLDRAEKPYFLLINNYGQILFFIPVDLKDITATKNLLFSIKNNYFTGI